MSPEEYLESIIEEATTALENARAGDDRAFQFQNTVSVTSLCNAHTALYDLNMLIDINAED